MKRFLSVSIVALMLCVSLSAVSMNALAEDVTGPFVVRNDGYPYYKLDIQATNYIGPYQIAPLQWRGQTFRPTESGKLVKISVYISDISSTGGNLIARICDADQADKPISGSVLAEKSIPWTSVPASLQWFNITFDSPPTLSAGVQYAIVLLGTTGFLGQWIYGGGTYSGGGLSWSFNSGSTWDGATLDFMFKTYMNTPTCGVRKVAWHPSGSFALGVTGQDSAVWEYYRELGSWSIVIADNGQVWNDIVYEPVWDRFYVVGHNDGGPSIPVAWEINPYDTPMTKTYMGSPPMTQGAFMGVCVASEGIGPYAFLAVGQNGSYALACWYQMGTGWKNAIGGDIASSDGHALYDVEWDKNVGGSYYAVGADGAYGMIYRLPTAGSLAPLRIIADRTAYHSINWQPDIAGANYALLTAEPGTWGNVQKFSGGEPTKLLDTDEVLWDASWHPDGTYAVIVGQNDAGSGGVAYRHIAGESNVISMIFMLPSGTGSLFGVAMKGPSSPSSGIIVGSGGGMSFYPSALNQDTTITVNAVVPKMYSIDFIDSDSTSRLDDQVAVDEWYNFTCVANYSQGWSNCAVEVRAWHDKGVIPGAYPAETDPNRNLAFRLYYWPWNSTYVLMYPAPSLEITIGTEVDTPLNVNPGIEDHHQVYLPVRFGSQLRWADGNGWASGDPATANQDNVTAFQDSNSWNFNVTIRDINNPTATNVSYAEFGIEKTISISVSGNPSGSAPPGTVDKLMTTNSNIIYSANTGYWVNVSIPHLYQNGLIGATNLIGAENVSVRNIHLTANATNSYISAQMHFPAAQNTPMNVWGRNVTALPPIGNGTVSAGPWVTDYNAGGSYDAFTEMQWWVTVAASVPEGVYIAIITITVDS